MDQSLPNISHPYPPTYRSQASSPSPNPQPPSGSSSTDYLQPQNPTNYGYSQDSFVPINPYSREERYTSAPSGGVRGSRLRSPSESSLHPVLPLEGGSGGGRGADIEGYPEGWSKEDEEAEREFLEKGMVNWEELRSWRFWIRKEWISVLSILVILMALYHDQIVDWLTPVANWMKNLPAGWTIPIAILFVISFPPLFGHEIVAIICGVVWGLWIGFGIVAAGTFLGELGNFYAFKYCCRGRAEKYERDNMNYACMAHVVREGGFLIVFVARLSAIPGHFTTAVFATCGMNVFIFMLAAALTTPKQLITVYLGVILEDKDTSSKNKIISDSVLAISFLVTILAAWYIYRQMHKARIVVWRRQRMALAAKGLTMKPVGKANGAITGSGSGGMSYGESYKESGNSALDEDDSRSPILARGTSYQNPYDIRYNQTDDMSVYHVMDQNYQGQDISSRPYNNSHAGEDRNRPGSQSFPEPQPADGVGINRAKSAATTIFSEPGGYEPDRQDFPVPSPAKPESMVSPRTGGLRGDVMSPPGSGGGTGYAR